MDKIIEDNLGFPVRISGPNENFGTGFLFKNINNIYLVTAKHVIFNKFSKSLRSEFLLISTSVYNESHEATNINVDLKSDEAKKEITFHPSADICVIRLLVILEHKEPNSFNLLPFVEWSNQGRSGLRFVYVEKNIGKLSEVMLSNTIFMYGFPTSLNLYKESLDKNLPLIRKGIVSGINYKKRQIILDCEAHYGNSGGPIVQISRENNKIIHKVIGIVTEFIPYNDKYINPKNGLEFVSAVNSGYSIVEPIDFILEITN
jgi:hypothetical protein